MDGRHWVLRFLGDLSIDLHDKAAVENLVDKRNMRAGGKEDVMALSDPFERACAYAQERFSYTFGKGYWRRDSEGSIEVFSGRQPKAMPGSVGVRLWRDESDDDRVKYEVMRRAAWLHRGLDEPTRVDTNHGELSNLLKIFRSWHGGRWKSNAVRTDVGTYFTGLRRETSDRYAGVLPVVADPMFEIPPNTLADVVLDVKKDIRGVKVALYTRLK